ncbi:hypothetical protein C7M84_012354 [Penaeus vannamei]|uniref:Uncharacterized protein n=1 Tax=Penaeus vannamei TaxID=6689 RepID=A0A3R7PKF9_PENVA|nr:hypothetical protein C7M84_012354 [Penaeus vannamei]
MSSFGLLSRTPRSLSVICQALVPCHVLLFLLSSPLPPLVSFLLVSSSPVSASSFSPPLPLFVSLLILVLQFGLLSRTPRSLSVICQALVPLHVRLLFLLSSPLPPLVSSSSSRLPGVNSLVLQFGLLSRTRSLSCQSYARPSFRARALFLLSSPLRSLLLSSPLPPLVSLPPLAPLPPSLLFPWLILVPPVRTPLPDIAVAVSHMPGLVPCLVPSPLPPLVSASSSRLLFLLSSPLPPLVSSSPSRLPGVILVLQFGLLSRTTAVAVSHMPGPRSVPRAPLPPLVSSSSSRLLFLLSSPLPPLVSSSSSRLPGIILVLQFGLLSRTPRSLSVICQALVPCHVLLFLSLLLLPLFVFLSSRLPWRHSRPPVRTPLPDNRGRCQSYARPSFRATCSSSSSRLLFLLSSPLPPLVSLASFSSSSSDSSPGHRGSLSVICQGLVPCHVLLFLLSSLASSSSSLFLLYVFSSLVSLASFSSPVRTPLPDTAVAVSHMPGPRSVPRARQRRFSVR